MVIKAAGESGVELQDLPDPSPGPGEVLVRMRAASLNYRDLVVLEGGYGSRQKRQDLVPLSDGAGEVLATGAGVNRWSAGDRVAACFFPHWRSGRATDANTSGALGGEADGVACELKVFRAEALVPIPGGLSFVEAATLPCAALTAWSAVRKVARAGPEDVVLTQGSGGVSLFTLQFARAAGSRVIATSSSAEKLERLGALGAAGLIDYRADPQWARTVRGMTDQQGADLVVDIGGGATIDQSIRAVRRGGTIAVIGVVGGAEAPVNLARVAMGGVGLQGVAVGSREDFLLMLQAIEAHGIRPVVDSLFPLTELTAALEHLKSGEHFGKVCVEI